MRHPAAPTIVAFLLGLLAFLVLWGRVSGRYHHEGNPGPGDVPRRMHEEEEGDGSEEEEDGEDERDFVR